MAPIFITDVTVSFIEQRKYEQLLFSYTDNRKKDELKPEVNGLDSYLSTALKLCYEKKNALQKIWKIHTTAAGTPLSNPKCVLD